MTLSEAEERNIEAGAAETVRREHDDVGLIMEVRETAAKAQAEIARLCIRERELEGINNDLRAENRSLMQIALNDQKNGTIIFTGGTGV